MTSQLATHQSLKTSRLYLDRIDTDTLKRPGLRCRDITPIFADRDAFDALLNDLLQHVDMTAEDAPSLVVGVDGLGLLLASAVASRLRLGLVPLRKAGKLPVKTDFALLPEPRGGLELRQGALAARQQILLVDDWIRTGSQIHAAISLVERQRARVSGILALNIDERDSTRELFNYRLYTVMRNGQPLEV
ncbi:MAG: phosphoribosyltransferase family protein [Deinococcota bacterium]